MGCSTLAPKEGIRQGVQKDGCILLADEMGLGKTLQAIGIAYEYPQQWPVLVVCPSSVRGMWRDEVKRFGKAPERANPIENDREHV
eukprot:5576040-Amphidinium_carterae.1